MKQYLLPGAAGAARLRAGSAGLLVILCLLSAAHVGAQPTVLGTHLPAGSYTTYNLLPVAGFKQATVQATASTGAGNWVWEFAEGTAGAPTYGTNWRPYTGPLTFSGFNNFIATSAAEGARYNTGSGGQSGRLPAVTSGNYYTFNVANNATADNAMQVLETTYAPVSIASVTPAATPGVGQPATVVATLSAAPSSGENVYIRWSTDNFSSSNNLVLMSVAGSTATGIIPGQAAGAVVRYYVLTTPKTAGQITSDNTTYSTSLGYDMATLSLNNNGGSNYSYTVSAVLCGAYTINASGSGPANYATFAAAFSALNTNGISCNTTFNVTGNFTESGLILGSAVLNASTNAGGTFGNGFTLTFQRDLTATANPKITSAGGAGSADAVVAIGGTDNVTFDRIDLGVSGTTVEYGYALLNLPSSTVDGTQFATIKGCVITLDKANTNAVVGISGRAVDTGNTGVTPTTALGTSSNNKFTGNTISNVKFGVQLAANTTFRGLNNQVGAVGSGNGNTITDFVGASGIDIATQNGISIVGNSIANGTVGNTTIQGINLTTSNAGTTTINGNTVTLTPGVTTTQATGIRNQSTLTTLTVDGNTVSMTASAATSGSVYAILNESGASCTTLNITNNIVAAYSVTGTGIGSVIDALGNANATVNITGNTISSSIRPGATGPSAQYGIRYNGVTVTVANNTISGVGINAGAGSVYGIVQTTTNPAATTSESIYGNTISGLSHNGSGTVEAIRLSNNNTTASIRNVYQNTIFSLSTGGSGACRGITFSLGSASSGTAVYRNKIYGLNGATTAGTVNAIYVVSASGAVTLSNNVIGNLTAPSANATNAIVAFNLSATASYNLYHNTVYLTATSSGTSFGSSVVAFGTNTLDLRNNIFINASTPGGGTATAVAAVLYSGATLNLATTSNNNLYYAGTPGAGRFLYFNGTTGDQTLAAYKTRTAALTPAASPARESNSATESVPFASTTGASATFLSPDPTKATQAADGGIATSVAVDYNGTPRNVATPDLGAYEDSFVAYDLALTALTAPATSQCATATLQPITVTVRNNSAGSVTTSATAVLTVTGTLTKPDASTVALSFTAPAATTIAGTSDLSVTFSPSQSFAPPGTYTLSSLAVALTDGQTPASAYRETDAVNNVLSPNPTITVNPLPTATASNSGPLCNGGSATVSFAFTGTGPWSYTYTDGTTPVSGSTSTSPLAISTPVLSASRTYSLTALSDAHCTATGSPVAATTVVVSNAPNFSTIHANVNCFGNTTGSITVSATGGTPPYRYSIDGGATYQISNFFNNLAAGSYQVVARNNAPQCAAAAQTVTITQPATAVTIVASKTDVTCQGGSDGTITATGSNGVGPYRYSIDNGSNYLPAVATSAPYTFSGLPVGTYTVLVRDANSCTASTGTILVSINPRPTASLSNSGVQCAGNPATIAVTLTGQGPWDFTWTDGTTPTTVTGVTSSPYTFSTGLLTTTTTVSITALSDAFCTGTGAGLGSTTVPVNVSSTWTGGASTTDWFSTANWTNCVPNRYVNAVIPASVGIYPDLNTATTAEVKTVTISAGGAITLGTGELAVYGDFASSGTANLVVPTATPGVVTGGTLSFNGPGIHQLSGVSEVFDFTINTSPSTTTTLLDPLRVDNQLTMTSGLLNTGAFSIELANADQNSAYGTATISETESSYVLGKVYTSHDLSTAGTTDTFGGLGLALTPAPASTVPGPTLVTRSTGTYVTGVGTSQSVLRQFRVQPTVDTGLDIGLAFQYFNHELNGAAANNVSLFSATIPSGGGPSSGPWSYYTASTIAALPNGTAPGTVTLAGLDHLSDWTLGNKANPLPVTLTRFEVQRQGADAELTWTTATEKNNRGFDIQVSADGRAFRTLHTVEPASANSNAPRRYGYTDREAGKTGLRYYRLRQLDLDGTATASPVRVLDFGREAQPSLSAAPNPFQRELTLTVQTATAQPDARLTVTDAAGRTVRTLPLALPAGLSRLALPELAELPRGVYLLHLPLAGRTQHLKVVKE